MFFKSEFSNNTLNSDIYEDSIQKMPTFEHWSKHRLQPIRTDGAESENTEKFDSTDNLDTLEIELSLWIKVHSLLFAAGRLNFIPKHMIHWMWINIFATNFQVNSAYLLVTTSTDKTPPSKWHSSNNPQIIVMCWVQWIESKALTFCSHFSLALPSCICCRAFFCKLSGLYKEFACFHFQKNE